MIDVLHLGISNMDDLQMPNSTVMVYELGQEISNMKGLSNFENVRTNADANVLCDEQQDSGSSLINMITNIMWN